MSKIPRIVTSSQTGNIWMVYAKTHGSLEMAVLVKEGDNNQYCYKIGQSLEGYWCYSDAYQGDITEL